MHKIINPKTGEVLETELDFDGAFRILQNVTGDFAESLVLQMKEKGSLSTAQTFWVYKLAEQQNKKPKPIKIKRPECVEGLSAWLEAAVTNSGFQVVALTFKLENHGMKLDSNLKIWVGGKFWGAFCKKGSDWFLEYQNENEEVLAFLRLLVADPKKTTVDYGKTTSHCCFCGLQLTNRISIYHGYGPICAGNYGLPYGDIANE
jgi:hypothetical protein